ncbi:MAG: outer membrane lipoprotein carrier protein LolA [Paludibacteraceae bacterium]|nr:outer membrane lipoprotein carrier protein LolA [Paludibacteraceae bacterium]
MKRQITTLILIALTLLTWAQKPVEVVDAVLKKMQAGGITTNYTLSVTEKGKPTPQIFRGKMTMLGSKYLIEADGMKIGFNGKTQWAYAADDNEVTLSEPTQEEISQMNPIALVKAYKQACKIIFSMTEKDQNFHVLEFYPKDKFADLKCLTIYVNKTSNVPARLTMTTNSGSRTEMKLAGVKTSQKIDAQIFEFKETAFPNAEINDLR